MDGGRARRPADRDPVGALQRHPAAHLRPYSGVGRCTARRRRGLAGGTRLARRRRAQPDRSAEREAIELATDQQMALALDALVDDLDGRLSIITPRGRTVVAAHGYLGGV